MSKRGEPSAGTAASAGPKGGAASDGGAATEARQRICQAAFQLFGTRGYSCTSIQDIADAAAVKKSILYYYFASKEALYQSLLVESATHLRELLHQGLRTAGLVVSEIRQLGPGSAEATLSTLAETILMLARDNRESVRFFLSHIFAVDSDRPPCSAVPIEQVPQTLILAAAEAGCASGELAGDPRQLELLILGGIQVSVIRHLRSPVQYPLPTGLGRALVQAVLEGFRPRIKGQKGGSSRQLK
jgi:AcrR family transcriptional regulator